MLPISDFFYLGHKHPTFSYAAASKRPKGPGLEYDGVSFPNKIVESYLAFLNDGIPQYIGVGCNCKRWGSDFFQWLDV